MKNEGTMFFEHLLADININNFFFMSGPMHS